MRKIFLKARTRVLPAAVAAVFVVSTAFLSSAAAQKMIQVAVSAQSPKTEKKSVGKISQTGVINSEAEGETEVRVGPGSGARTASSNAASAGTDSPDSEEEATTSNSAIVPALAQATNSVSVQNGQNGILANSPGNTRAVSATSALVADNTAPGKTSGRTFTLQTLALHNKAGDCYIAYKGAVYDLSAVTAWTNCQHHGATGGIDVTSMLPHPVSYFNSVPVIGILGAPVSTAGQTSNSSTSQNSQSGASSGAAGGMGTNIATSGQASGSSGTQTGSGNVGSSVGNQSGWQEDDGFVRSQTSIFRQSRFEDDESGD